MAKEQEAASTASIAARVKVEHHSSHDASPSVGEVMLSGKRIAYVFYNEGYPVSFLPFAHTKVKLTAAQCAEIEAEARKQVTPLAEAEAKELAGLKAYGV